MGSRARWSRSTPSPPTLPSPARSDAPAPTTCADDQSRLRKGHGAHNMAVVRHFALNLVRSAPDMPPPARSPLKRGPKPSPKPKAMSLKLRRKMAGWNSAYMQTVLGQSSVPKRVNRDSEPCRNAHYPPTDQAKAN